MLNSIVIMGRLVADPELRTTQSGVSTVTVRVAVDRNYTRQGEEKQTDFFDIVAWRSTAEFVSRYMQKGSLVAVQGSMQSRKWQDKDGNNRISWEVQADNVYFAESKKKEQSAAYPTPQNAQGSIDVSADDDSNGFKPITAADDLPF